MKMECSLGVIVPIYGQDPYTNQLLNDISRDLELVESLGVWVQVLLVDNKGDYNLDKKHFEYTAYITPGTNLRWTKGTNYGLRVFQDEFEAMDAFVCINNDVRLSVGFLAGIAEALAWNPLCGLLAPVYDDVHASQRSSYTGKAADYCPQEIETETKFVDGTCMVIPQHTLNIVGLLDEEHFGEYGWGADFDYSYRVRQAGGTVMVTHRAFLNHFHQGTAKTESTNWNGLAGNEMEAGMNAKYGEGWRNKIL